MSVYKALQQIQAQRETEAPYPGSKAIRTWPSPVVDKATKRRQLTLNSKQPRNRLRDRGDLTIHLIDHKGGYESLVKRSLSVQVDQFEAILESRIQELKSEFSR